MSWGPAISQKTGGLSGGTYWGWCGVVRKFRVGVWPILRKLIDSSTTGGPKVPKYTDPRGRANNGSSCTLIRTKQAYKQTILLGGPPRTRATLAVHLDGAVRP